MPSVGTAYVNIRISTKSFTSQLEAMMAKLSKQMETSGSQLGKDFEKGLKSTNFDRAFDPAVKAATSAETKMSASATKVADSWKKTSTSVSNDSHQMETDLGGASKAAEEFSRSTGAAGRSASGLSSSMSGMGRGGGGLRSAAGDASFFGKSLADIEKQAARDMKMLEKLHDSVAFFGTAVTGVVASLSAVGQGLFAVGANAAAAAPALAVFTNGLIGMAQVGGTIGLAMGGVGKALTAGFTGLDKTAVAAAGATTGLGDATAAAARAVRDAKESLQNAYRDAARSAEDAARRTAAAEATLAAATQATAQAQRDLNDAYAVGYEQLRQIGFAAEQASIDQDNAALALQDAQDNAQATSDLAQDDPARVKALIELRQAELNYREAKDASNESDKESKKGIEDTDAVVAGHKDVADAQDAERAATNDLADARREQARTAADNAQKIADAQQGLADAQGRLADAQKQATTQMKAATTAADAYKLALSKLSPAQREFVKRIVGLRDEFYKARQEIANPLFVGLNNALTTLLRGDMIGKVGDQLTITSGNLGDFAEKAAGLAENDMFQGPFIRVLQSNNDNMGKWGDVLLNLADAFVQVADASRPLVRRFSDWAQAASSSLDYTTRLNNQSGDLTKTINHAGDRVSEFWGLLKELWRTLRIVGTQANRAANQFDDLNDKDGTKGYIPNLTESLTNFNDKLDTVKGRQKLFDGFTQSLRNLNAAGRAIHTILQPFVDLGQNKQVENALDIISSSDAFKRIGDQAGNALPDLAQIVVNVADFIAAISESHAIDHFIHIMSILTGWVAKLVGLLADTGILKWTGYITGALAAWRLLNRGIAIAKSPFILLSAGYQRFMTNMATAKAQGKGLFAQLKAGAKGAAAGPAAVAKVAGAGGAAEEGTWEAEVLVHLKGIIAAVETCCATLSRAMAGMGAEEALGGAGGGMLGAAPAIEREAGAAAGAAGGLGAVGGEVGQVGKFAGVLGKFSKFAGPLTKMMKPLSLGIRAIGGAMRFALGPWGILILTLLPILWPLLVKLNEKFHILDRMMTALKWTLDKLVDAFQWMWDKIKDLFDWVKSNWPLLLGILTGPIGLAVILIIKNWDKVLDFIKGIPGKIEDFLSGMWGFITDGLDWLWDHVTEVWGNVLGFIKTLPRKIWNLLKNTWRFYIQLNQWLHNKIWALFGTILTYLKKIPGRVFNMLRNIWKVITDKLSDAWDTVQRIWGRIITWVKYRPTQFRLNLARIWDVITDKLADAWDWVQTKWSNIKNAISRWPGQIASSLKNIWNGIGEGVISAWNWVGRKVDWLVGKLNGITDTFNGPQINVSWPQLAWNGYAAGGPVRGPGGPKSDRIAARLSDGEHVLTAAEVKALGGHSNVIAMRKAALQDPGSGGLFGSVVDKFKSVGSAIANGAQTAIKWVLGQFTDLMPDNFVGNFVASMITNAADKFTGWGKAKDVAAAKVSGASNYKGPPTGWTYAVPSSTHSFNYPGHNPASALDIEASTGTPLRASSGGKIRGVYGSASDTTSYGLHVIIDHAGGWSTLYGHMSQAVARQGQIVRPGTLLGKTGASGGVTGPHLHLEITRKPGSSSYPDTHSQAVKRGLKWPYKYGGPWADGGVIAPQTDGRGVLALLAEAGKAERVTPLDSEGFTPAERKMLERLDASLNNGGGGDTYHVHPSRGMDETALADKVIRRVGWNRRRGTGRR